MSSNLKNNLSDNAQLQLDISFNDGLLKEFNKYISYQNNLDFAKQNSTEYNLEDRLMASILKKELIKKLQSIPD